RSTRLAYCLNCLASPRRRARSRIVMTSSVGGGKGPPQPALHGRELPARGVRRELGGACGGALLAALAALLAVALDLAAELLRDQVDGVVEVARRVLGPEGDALQVERRLGHHVVRVGRVALLADLDLQHGELRDL